MIFLGKGGNGKVKTEKGEFRELRRNRGTEKGSVIFDLSDWRFEEMEVQNRRRRKRWFICDLSAFLEKGGWGYCVCEKKVVTLQAFCATGDMIKTILTTEETIKNNY